MQQVSEREVLQSLAEEPLGGPDLQRLAENAARRQEKPPPAVRQMAKRINKIFLPRGKRTVRDADERQKQDDFAAKQIDLEDAVEAAGGSRGG
jgi:hypothetical protein